MFYSKGWNDLEYNLGKVGFVATGYEPNIEGALAVLVDLMIGEGVTMAREPYAPNFRGLVDALIDLQVALDVSGVSTSTTRTLAVLDSNGTIATEDFATAVAIALG